MNDSTMREYLTVAERVGYEGEPLTPEDLDLDAIEDPTDALDVYRRAVRQRQAAAAVEHAAAQRLAELLGEGGAVRYGDNIVRYQRGWRERCIDPAGFWDGVALLESAGEVKVRDLFNPNDVKKTPMPKALRDTFFDRTRNDDPTLTVGPVDLAPKFLQALGDGDIWKAAT
jgi:hypothetical protein